jgi:hypothetical protein
MIGYKRTIKLAVEELEARCVLTHGLVPVIVEVPDQPLTLTPADMQRADELVTWVQSKLPVDLQGKVGVDTWQAVREIEALVMDRQIFWHDGLPLSQVALQEAYGARLNDAGEVLLQLDFDELNDATLDLLQQQRVRIEGVIPEYQRVFGWVHGLEIRLLGAVPGLARIEIPLQGVYRDELVDPAASSTLLDLPLSLLVNEESATIPLTSAVSDESALLEDLDLSEHEVYELAIVSSRDAQWQWFSASVATAASPATKSIFDLELELPWVTDTLLTVGVPNFFKRG